MVQYQMVPVPEDLVEAVYAFITKARNGSSSGDKGDAVLSPDWTDDEIVACYHDSSPEMKQFHQMLAEQAEEWVRGVDLYPQVGYSAHQFAGATGAFGRLVSGRFRKSKWFIEAKEDADGWVIYQMSAHVAELIRKEADSN